MKRVLFIKANQLGDSIVNLPVVESLVERLGGAQVGVITTPIAKDLYRNLIPNDNLFVIPRDDFNKSYKAPGRLVKIGSWIRRFHPDRIMIPSDQGYVARTLSRILWPGRVYEMENNKVDFPKWGTHWEALDRGLNIHRNNWKLFQAFANAERWKDVPALPPRPEKAWGFPPTRDTAKSILIHPGSSREATRWAEQNYVNLALKLAAAEFEILWIDESKVRPEAHGRITILERKPLLEFAKVAAECALFIGNNSGPMHLCDALNVPLLILSGPVGKEWDPFWSNRRKMLRMDNLPCQPCEGWHGHVVTCPRLDEPFACMSRANVDLAFSEALKILENQPLNL